ncbi:LPS export ABC transporter permease LptG [Thiofaba sp. EF100]|uniref:LPS export ABC transporter permease LptG n=1 Tax=Thiofaba sp. EF100 TaxID=3121274 RepID=UPI0032220FA8
MRLDLYVLRTVLGGTLVTLGALLGLAVILLLLDEIDKVEGAYTLGKAMLFVLYMLPGYMLEFFPLATLVGSLMALGQLAAGNEITAMRAAGVSLGRLARPVLAAGVLLGLVGMLMGETLGPLGQTQARLMRAEALGHTLSMQGEQGLWLREQERFVHLGYVTPGGELHQVRAFAFGPDQTLREALLLEQATPGEQGWEASKVSSNTFRPESVSMAFDAQRRLPALVPANLLNVLVVLPQYMSMQELWRYARFLDANGLESASYWLAWWGKLFAPLQVVAMLLLALPFALATRRTGGAGQRMVLGILLGLAILILTRLLTQGGLLIGLPAWFAALLPPVLFLALAILGLRRGVV